MKDNYNMYPINIQYLGYLMNFSLLKLDSNLFMLSKHSTTALAWLVHSSLSSLFHNLFFQHSFRQDFINLPELALNSLPGS